MKNKILITLAIIATGFDFTFAQQPSMVISDKAGWHKIGERTVDFTKDRDEILVLGADRFASLKFKVTDAAIDLQDMEIYYENGKREDIQVRTPLLQGSESRIIDLNGGESSLKKIVFVYKTLPNRKEEKAIVEIWGLKTNVNETQVETAEVKEDADDLNPESGEVPKPAVVINDKSGWHKIASTHVDFKKDRDEVKVIGKDHFRQIKLKVTDASIELDELIVHFENDNTPQKIGVRSLLKQGSETRNIDLEGRNKAINKIGLVYKTINNPDKERAEVEIWGLK